jgi:hypothetical protein
VVSPGQIMRKQVPAEKTKDVVEFATKRPEDRLASIRQGIEVGRCLILVTIRMTIHIADARLWSIRVRPPIRHGRPNSGRAAADASQSPATSDPQVRTRQQAANDRTSLDECVCFCPH